jgi:anthranilate 1,2-dioxygenase small subunit
METQIGRKVTPDYLIKKEEIVSYLHYLCYLLDDYQIEKYVEEYTDEGHYKLIPRENHERDLFVSIIDDSKKRLRYRRDLILKHWHHEKFRENRSLSNILVEFPADDVAEAKSNFVIYQSNEEGVTNLHLTGVFEDRLVRRDDRWRIQNRLAVLDTFMPNHAIVVPP